MSVVSTKGKAMTTAMTPYLRFGGVAREAMEFYQSVYGGELSVMTFQEGMGETNPQLADQVMHSSLYVGTGVHIMASDTPPEMNVSGNGAIAISDDGSGGDADASTLKDWWAKLSEGSRIDVPLDKAPWGDSFGQLTDRYGVTWMFNIAGTTAGS